MGSLGSDSIGVIIDLSGVGQPCEAQVFDVLLALGIPPSGTADAANEAQNARGGRPNENYTLSDQG